METNQRIDIPGGDRRILHSLSWGAIIGGTVAAIGIHILITALGVGAGLGTFTPRTDANPVTNFSIGAAVVWTIGALVALWFGGFVAGRFSHSRPSGFVHGILVWSLTLIITLLLLSMGTGMILGGALKALGGGLGIAGKAVASSVGGPASDGVKRGVDQLGSFIDEAVQSLPANAPAKTTTRAKREIGFAVAKLFAPGNDITSQDNRTAAIKALTEYAEMSEADATKAVDAWITSYTQLKEELDSLKKTAEEKAREAADRAAQDLSRAAIWSFFALLTGLLVTTHGSTCGVTRALKAGDDSQRVVPV